MTLEQKQAYLKNSGKCPYCGSTNIEGGSYDFDGDSGSQPIECLDCQAEWNDIYKLVDVEAPWTGPDAPAEDKTHSDWLDEAASSVMDAVEQGGNADDALQTVLDGVGSDILLRMETLGS